MKMGKTKSKFILSQKARASRFRCEEQRKKRKEEEEEEKEEEVGEEQTKVSFHFEIMGNLMS